jgi:hypothetical protein
MGSNLTFVFGATRIDLNNRTGLFLQSGYYPTIDVKAKTVTESVKVQLRGSISAVIQQLNQWFELARSDDPAQEKVYLEYKVAESETAWRSRIYNGAVSLSSTISREYQRGRVNVEISFERDPFWEGPETTLPITNLNSNNPARVFNANDGAGTIPNQRINSAYVAANMILGDLPTPVKLTIDNLYTEALGHLWIGMNKTRPNWNSGWMLEAENAIGITPVASSVASGGAFAQGQLTYGSSSAILRWNVTDTMVSVLRGQRLRMLLRAYYTGAYSNFKYKLKIVSGVTILWETDWVRESETYARNWLDMFEFRMPPWLEGKEDLSGITLELWATPTNAGTWTWAFDDVMLFSEDGFVNLDTWVVAGGKLIIDGETGWSEDMTGKKVGLRKMIGSLMLSPGAFHLFQFAMHEIYMNSAPIDFVIGVSGTYRPRRWSI